MLDDEDGNSNGELSVEGTHREENGDESNKDENGNSADDDSDFDGKQRATAKGTTASKSK
jgi:hypothetical protein